MFYRIGDIELAKAFGLKDKPPVDEAFLSSMGEGAKIVGSVERSGNAVEFTVEVDGKRYRCRQTASGTTARRDGTTIYFGKNGSVEGFRTDDGTTVEEYDEFGRLVFEKNRATGQRTTYEYNNPLDPFRASSKKSYSTRWKKSRYFNKRAMRRWRRSRRMAKLRRHKLGATALSRQMAELRKKLENKDNATKPVKKVAKVQKMESSAPIVVKADGTSKVEASGSIAGIAAAVKGALLALATHNDNARLISSTDDSAPPKASVVSVSKGEQPAASVVRSTEQLPFFSAELFVESAISGSEDGSTAGIVHPAAPTMDAAPIAHEPEANDEPAEVSQQSQPSLVALAAQRGSVHGQRAEDAGLETFVPFSWSTGRSPAVRKGGVVVKTITVSVFGMKFVIEMPENERAMVNASRFGMPLPVLFGASNVLDMGRVTQNDRLALLFTRSKQGERQGKDDRGGQGGRDGRDREEPEQDGSVTGVANS